MLNARCLHSDSEIAAIRNQWSDLYVTPFQSPDWLLSWWNAYQCECCELSVVVFEDVEEQLQGIAPFYVNRSPLFGRRLQFLGNGQACTDFQTVLCNQEYRAEVIDSLSSWCLRTAAEQKIDSLDLDGVSTECSIVRELGERLQEAGWTYDTTPSPHTWQLDLTGGWDGFLSRLSRTQRRQSQNLINRFDKSEVFHLKRTRSQPEFHQALRTFMELHQKRWNSAGKPGCFQDHRFRQFVESACCDLSSKSRVEVASLYAEDRPVAAQLLLFSPCHTQAFVYQAGRDPEFDDARVGRMLNLACIRALASADVETVDYLRGDELYKARLKCQPSSCHHVRLIAPTPLPQLRQQAIVLGRGIKSSAKKLLRRFTTPDGNQQSLAK